MYICVVVVYLAAKQTQTNKQTNKQTMNINKITSLAAIAAISCAASGYAASNDALLDLLVKKGVLSQTEATAVAVELKEDQPVFVGVKGGAG